MPKVVQQERQPPFPCGGDCRCSNRTTCGTGGARSCGEPWGTHCAQPSGLRGGDGSDGSLGVDVEKPTNSSAVYPLVN